MDTLAVGRSKWYIEPSLDPIFALVLPVTLARLVSGLPLVALIAWAIAGLACRSYAMVALPALLLGTYYGALTIFGALALGRSTVPGGAHAPSVSVLIPAHNEASVIERTLTSVTAQDHPDYEVIVIDDHSTDGTAALTETWPVRTLRLTGGGPSGKSEALNAGLAIARGQVIVVLDADARIAPEFLRRGAERLAGTPDACALQAGLRIDNPDDTLWTALQADELGILNDCIEAARTRLGGATRVLGNGQFVRREALLAVGGWQNGLVDDLDLTLRLVLAGQGRVVAAPDLIVHQEAVPTLSALLRQRARWFEGHLQTAGATWGRVAIAPHLPLRLKADLLLCLASVLMPLVGLLGLVAGAIAQVPGLFHDAGLAALNGLGSLAVFLLGLLTVGRAARRVEGTWRWRPLFTYALLMPVFFLALSRALFSLATGGAGRWDKTARVAQTLEGRP